MKIAIFNVQFHEKKTFAAANRQLGHELIFIREHLDESTAHLAQGAPCVSAFVNDCLNRETLEILKQQGCGLIALRSAGYNHINLSTARELNLKVTHVPDYSPEAVAEHAVALLMTLARKTHRSYLKVREGNFDLTGLMGVNIHGKTVGVVGTGKIGKAFARIMRGFGCTILLNDLVEDNRFAAELGASYVSFEDMCRRSDILSLHLPLTPMTRRIFNHRALECAKPGLILLNTGRGGLIDTDVVLEGLKNGKISLAGLDVYEAESAVFYGDHTGERGQDDRLASLIASPNVLLTGHHGFLTETAVANIADGVLRSVTAFEKNEDPPNQL